MRLRLDQSVHRAALLLPIPLVYAVGAIATIKIVRPSADAIEWILLGGLVPLAIPVVAVAHVWLTRRAKYSGALALDKHHALHDRVSSALSFNALPKEKRTPLMEAAIDDAVAVARDLEPRRAAPVRFPWELAVSAALVAVVVGIALLEVRTYREVPPDRTFDPLVMSPDDLELFRKAVEDLQEENKDPETLAAIRKFNQLVEDIANRRLDRREVFKRMEELDRDLLKGAEADKDALDEGLKRMAKELEKSELTKPIAKPLEEKRLEDAEKAMRELAEKLKNKKKPPSKAELERLRKALEKASKTNSEWKKNIEERRKQLENEKKRLLKKKKDQKKLSKRDKSLLKKKERQLERLNREKERQKRSQRQLSRLDRELAKAAADLMKELGMSAEDIEQAAQDINRMAQEEMTQKEKEELRKRLQEMRELIRQQGKGGKKRLQRLLKFGKRARGGRPGKPGQGSGQGKGQQGKGGKGGKGGTMPGGMGGDTLVIGPGMGGKSIPIPGSGSGSGQGSMPGQGGEGKGGDKPGGGGGKGGESWGTGSDPNLKGDKSKSIGKTKDVTAAGIDTGEGEASAEVIHGAAQRGFVGRGYQKVYTDYQTVAESVMNRDDIPPGYRFYVRRYFQLIRPRE